MKDLKKYIDYLIGSKISKEDALDMLKRDIELNNDEKNIIYAYCYPRPLLHKELTNRIIQYRTNKGNMSGSLNLDIGEITLLIESERTEQYSRFIRHLVHAFIENSDIYPILGENQCNCDLCGKQLFEYDLWDRLATPDKPERENKEYLVFGSSETKIHLCLDCLVQLRNMYEITETYIDPGHYSKFKSQKHSWEELKL